jgi:AAA domain
MVVLDTLNRSFVGSESKDEDMASYIRAAEVIRNQWDCIVVIVHHCGHDTSRPRGHSGLTAAVDAQIAITREEGSDIIVATVEFMRDGPEGQEVVGVARKIEVGEDAGGKVLTSLVIEPHDQKDGANRPNTSGMSG